MTEWIPLLAFAARYPGQPLGLATLVARQGSSYRRPGARLLFASDAAYAGCLSGGCLEADLVRVSLPVLFHGQPTLHLLDTRPHYGCPGQLEILVEPLAPALLEALNAAVRRREPLHLVTHFAPDHPAPGTHVANASSASESGSSSLASILQPRPRLIVVSGTDDAAPVCELARFFDWDVWQIDTSVQPDLSSPQRIYCPPEQLIANFPPDARTAVLVMTHHLARDLAYLRRILPAAYPYIGLLGSRHRRETLLAELGESGLLADETLATRLHAPVGLDLGADGPKTIALAIIAEIQATWHARTADPLQAHIPN